MKSLINEIIEWWNLVKNETVAVCGDEYNVYDEPPRFVKMAMELSQDIDNSPKLVGNLNSMSLIGINGYESAGEGSDVYESLNNYILYLKDTSGIKKDLPLTFNKELFKKYINFL